MDILMDKSASTDSFKSVESPRPCTCYMSDFGHNHGCPAVVKCKYCYCRLFPMHIRSITPLHVKGCPTMKR